MTTHATIDHSSCNGCGDCVRICPPIFGECRDRAKIAAIQGDIPDDLIELCKTAIENCPVRAITLMELSEYHGEDELEELDEELVLLR